MVFPGELYAVVSLGLTSLGYHSFYSTPSTGVSQVISFYHSTSLVHPEGLGNHSSNTGWYYQNKWVGIV